MTPLSWKLLLGLGALASITVAEVSALAFGWPQAGMAPFCALCAAVAHSATLISGGHSKQALLFDFLVRIVLVAAVLFSAVHWLLSLAPDPNRLSYLFLGLVALVGASGVVIGLIVAVRER